MVAILAALLIWLPNQMRGSRAPGPTSDAGGLKTGGRGTTQGIHGRLAFQRWNENRYDIFSYDLDSGKLSQLTNEDNNWIPRWSPTGLQIAHVWVSAEDKSNLYLMNSDGTMRRAIASALTWSSFPAWSKDSKLAFVGYDEQGASEGVYIGSPDATGFTRLTNETGRAEWPSWTPDGTKIAFASNRNGNMDIWIMNQDGSDQTLFVDSPASESEPAWSPVRNEIVYTERSGEATEFGKLLLFNTEYASPIKELTPKGEAANPAWSPDGQWIAFSRWVDSNGDGHVEAGDDSDLWAVNATTNELVPLVEGPGYDILPSWTR